MGDVIKAELESLDSFATFLGDQIPELTADLNDLKNQMDTITSSAWKDKGGEGFKTSFSSFITDALKMNEELLKDVSGVASETQAKITSEVSQIY